MKRALLLALLFSTVAFAQPEERKATFTLGGYTGPYLPSLFTGITETLMVLGARAAYGEDVFKFELNGFRSSEKGMTVNYLIGSLAMHLEPPNIDFLRIVVMGGLQTVLYRRGDSGDGQTFPFARGSGIHLGGGFIIPFNPVWSLRTQYTIFNGPGRCVLVEAGLEYTFGGSSSETSTNQR